MYSNFEFIVLFFVTILEPVISLRNANSFRGVHVWKQSTNAAGNQLKAQNKADDVADGL